MSKRQFGVTFSYDHPIGHRSLHLRLDPYEVEWTYELMTNVVDTYGGQVVQILGVKIGTFTIVGQFGKEGPWGQMKAPKDYVDRRGWKMPIDGWAPRPEGETWIYSDKDKKVKGNKYANGLTQMTQFFREYFEFNAQGGGTGQYGNPIPGSYLQVPMNIQYAKTIPKPDINLYPPDPGGETAIEEPATKYWQFFPTSFPSYKRSNDDFAPEWRVVGEVLEAPDYLTKALVTKEIDRLNKAIGYNVPNPWSDPLADPEALSQGYAAQIASVWHNLLPNFTQGQIEAMIWNNITMQTQLGEKPGYSPETPPTKTDLSPPDLPIQSKPGHGGV